ncbi:hypothetical protein Nepgr_003739 [Nepenthes gracilis]|uniref:Uncharacterized protein n=1 Tax=Nepenthes gracilis TaxID=150966 RepID=A0AAD3S032_NEPGR|nr:hypothetical protein Nepgr_003739 [Nepenthes gracilis]
MPPSSVPRLFFPFFGSYPFHFRFLLNWNLSTLRLVFCVNTKQYSSKIQKMNYCAIQQNCIASTEETRNSVSFMSNHKESVVCPKPRRMSSCLKIPWTTPPDLIGGISGTELLDIILAKGGHGAERTGTQVASLPPFFSGSPPGRVSNPLVQDARFSEVNFPTNPPPAPPIPAPSGSTSSPTSSARKGGCVRANFGNNPAARIEGFDCLDRDHRNCGVLTLA